MAAIAAGLVLLAVLVAWFLVGGYFPWRYHSQWVVATLAPQICWVPGQRNSNGLSDVHKTEWSKMSSVDVWYRSAR